MQVKFDIKIIVYSGAFDGEIGRRFFKIPLQLILANDIKYS